MSDEITIRSVLGSDAPLLLAPDDWLENRRRYLQTQMALLADELDGVISAQAIKDDLQQTNRVAVECVETDEEGQPRDIVIRICGVVDAIKQLERNRLNNRIPKDISRRNMLSHYSTWDRDGYDVDGAQQLQRLA